MSSRIVSKGSGAIPKTKANDPSEFPPLEKRTIESKSALSKKWVSGGNTKWVSFYLPSPVTLVDHGVLERWVESMEFLLDDLRWLLQLPHHQFWSVIVFCPAVREQVLSSFLKFAPRFYDTNYSFYEAHSIVWPIYKDVYLLVFRIYMRLATYKESKEDHITLSYWTDLLHKHGLINMQILESLATLYESKDNLVFKKMVESLMKHMPRLMQELEEGIPSYNRKFNDLHAETNDLIASCTTPEMWQNSQAKFEQILSIMTDAIYCVYKFVKAYTPAAELLLRAPHFILSMPTSYELNSRRWGKIVSQLPNLEDCVSLCRAAILRLYRFILTTPTLFAVESANDKRLDDFFDFFSNSIDEKIFIHDYEKNFPFKADMQFLLSKGIFVDETRIDYMANAISACFHSCGEEYSIEKIVVDPFYDPNFDRQLLGACSLEISGVELASLVSQVKDLLPDLPNSYVEAVLKHYGYKTDITINALLESSVPSRLEKYKSEDYIKSQAEFVVSPTHKADDQDKLPVDLPGEKFVPAKSSQRRTLQEEPIDQASKLKIKQLLENIEPERPKIKSKNGKSEETEEDSYIDESLLPKFSNDVDYDDEYDDTYDDVGAGMTEPDNVAFKPPHSNHLNLRKAETVVEDGAGADDQEEETANTRNSNDAFCEDPAIIRARIEKKRQEKYDKRYHNTNSHQPAPPNRDVVGKTKGQGQEKDVVYNRRQKTANKGSFNKQRSDFKRKEF